MELDLPAVSVKIGTQLLMLLASGVLYICGVLVVGRRKMQEYSRTPETATDTWGERVFQASMWAVCWPVVLFLILVGYALATLGWIVTGKWVRLK